MSVSYTHLDVYKRQDQHPRHDLNRTEESSWCGYNLAKVSKESYTQRYFHSETVFNKIKPSLKYLSNETILSKCCLGKTQNPNESFNCENGNGDLGKLRKTIFVGITTLKVGECMMQLYHLIKVQWENLSLIHI